MLSKAVQFYKQVHAQKTMSMFKKTGLRAFSHGPYNPLHYKAYLVPEELPT